VFVPMPPPEQARWFYETVQPHEPALRAYLLKRFPALPDHDDVIQEAYLRMLRMRDQVRDDCAKAYLFAVARNAAIDLFRRRRASPCDAGADLEALPAAADTPDAAALLDASHQQQTLFEAVSALPPRCREVMMLRYIEGLPARDIAARLGLAVPTVKIHLVKGVRDCARFFAREGLLEELALNEKEETA
jgi:RNA polymerase sigma-70 factor (ECF subfamily)